MVSTWGLFECISYLPTGEISKGNCDREILGVLEKQDHSVPSRKIMRKLRVYFQCAM